MSDKIVVGNLEKLQDQICEFVDTYVWKERLTGQILAGNKDEMENKLTKT